MGWTGIFDAIRKSNGTIDRKATLERDFSGWSNGESITKMLKGSMAGSVFYAAMETTSPDGREVWALVVLTSVNGGEFCYKEMDETCGPCEATCPVSILDALTPTTNETANAWRQRCRENIEKKKTGAGRIPRNATQLYITFLVDTSASKKGDSCMVYKIDGAWVYTSKSGGRWRLTAAMLRNPDVIQVNGTEEPAPAPQPEPAGIHTNEDTTTRPQDGHTAPETETAGETTTSSEKAPQEHKTALYKYGMRLRGYSIGAQPAGVVSREDDQTGKFYDIIAYNAPLSPEDVKHYSLTPLECPTTAATTPDGETTTEAETAPQEGTQDATERPKRRTAYMVECRSPRGSWKQYSGEKDTREEAEKIKEEAEAQRACTINGDLILYRIVQLDKGQETASQDAPTARQTAGTNAAEETPTEATKASQDATPATAAGAAESTPGAPTTAGTIAADTRTAGATKAAPQGQKRATAAGGIANRTKNANKAGHARKIAPGRTERREAGQTTTPPHKRPLRGKYKATHARPPKFGKICAKIRVPSGALYFTGAG